jgi:protein-tyrosine kinase
MSRIGDALKRAGQPGTGPIGTELEPLYPPPEPRSAPAATAPVPDVEEEPELPASVPREREHEHDFFHIPGPDAPRPPLRLFEPFPDRIDEKIIVHPDSPPVAVEQYRRLAALMHHAQQDRGLKTMMVASALAKEGKTLTAVNLALTLSESYRRRVLLMDADLRRPSVAERFGLLNLRGLTEALQAPDDTRLEVVRLSPTLSVLPAGQPMSDPMHVLTSNRMRRIVEEARMAFDWVLLDSPPVALLTDANLMAAMVDGAILVVGAGETQFPSIQRAIDAIGRERILGVILNRVGTIETGEYYHGYYTAYPSSTSKAGLFRRLLKR